MTALATTPAASAAAPGPDFAAAQELFDRDDWDAGGTVAVCRPHDIALRLLAMQGWTVKPMPRGGHMYIKPGGKHRDKGGKFGEDFLWERDDALRVALAAEALRR